MVDILGHPLTGGNTGTGGTEPAPRYFLPSARLLLRPPLALGSANCSASAISTYKVVRYGSYITYRPV